jgi:inner membrane protein
MCTVITHPAIPIALSVLLPAETASSSLLLAGCACSVIPDLDVIGFHYGIKYADMFGHRGFTHSIFFAAALAVATTVGFFQECGSPAVVFWFLFVSTLSHSILDALTDGGLGVGFFAPFNNRRYFFSCRPIKVAPIGIGGFFTRRGGAALLSELWWVWLPAFVVYAAGQFIKRATAAV